MLEIVKTPAQEIGNTGFISRWLATDAPIEFWAQRKDNLISSVANNGGNFQINLSTANSIFYPVVGEFISLHAQGAYYIVQVLSKQSDSQYTIALSYNASTVFDYYVAHQKPVNYYVDIKLSINGIEQQYLAEFTPNINGLCKCDVSGYLQSYVNDDKRATVDGDVNVKETNQSGSFTFYIRENYIGNVNSSFVLNQNTWYYIKGARSIEKGSNVSEFVPNLSQQTEFLNYFEEPTCYVGLPFDISFIYSELLAGKSVQVIEEHYNSLNVMLSTQTRAIDSTQIGSVNSLVINVEAIESTCDYMKLRLITDDAQPPVVQDTWYITTAPFTPSKPMKFTKNGTDVTVSFYIPATKLGGIVPLPDVSLTPTTEKIIGTDYSTPFFQYMYQDPPRNFYELGISASEFSKFNKPTRFHCAIFMNKTYAVGFVDLDPAVITTKVAFMNAIKTALDSCVNSINTILNIAVDYLHTMNSNEEDRARSRVYIDHYYEDVGFLSMAYWYFEDFVLDVYPGTQTSYYPASDSGKVLYDFSTRFDYAKIKPDGNAEFATYNTLGCRIASFSDKTYSLV